MLSVGNKNMVPNYQYTGIARWTRGRSGIVNAETVEQPIGFSSPPEFHGEAGSWTPEHFLVAAAAGCFVTTFLAIAELSKFEYVAIEASATGTLEKAEGGFRFTRVMIRPELTIAHESDRERALRLLEKTERSCLVSRSLRSEVLLEPKVLVQTPVSAI
jgi:peroxiredoxin-like protein